MEGDRVRMHTVITNNIIAEAPDRIPAILIKNQAYVWVSQLKFEKNQVDDLLKPALDKFIKITKVNNKVKNSQTIIVKN